MTQEEREMLFDNFSIDYSHHQPLFIEFLRSSSYNDQMISIQKMRDTCTEWMSDIAKLLQDSNRLLEQITSANQLITVEQQVWEQLQSNNSNNSKDIWSSARKMLLPDSFQDLWSSMFFQLFFNQSKQIIINKLNSLSISSLIESELEKINKNIQNNNNNTENNENNNNLLNDDIGKFVWLYNEDETLENIKSRSNGISESLVSIVQCLDKQLFDYVQEFNFLTNEETKKKYKSSTYSQTRQKSIIELREFIQNYCYETISKLIEEIGTRMNNLLKDSNLLENNDNNNNSIAQILFLAQLSSSISENSIQIPKLLPPATVNDGNNSRFSKMYSSYFSLRTKIVNNPLKDKLSRNCQFEYIKGYLWWCFVKTNHLIENLENSLHSENWSNSSIRKSTWTTIEVSMQANSKEQIKVPNFPSAFISRLLFQGCECFHQQAAHSIDSSIIKFFSQILILRIISVYQRFLQKKISSNPKNISREGLVQILFDVRFIFDILAGTYQNTEDWPELLKDAFNEIPKSKDFSFDFDSKIRALISSFLSELKKYFEPIDLAFYEPRVQQYVQKCYLQNVVSLGYFVNTKRLYTQAYVLFFFFNFHFF